MAGTVSSRLSLAAYVDYLQESYYLSDMEVATLLTKLASHYIMKDSKYGQCEATSHGEMAGTEST